MNTSLFITNDILEIGAKYYIIFRMITKKFTHLPLLQL